MPPASPASRLRRRGTLIIGGGLLVGASVLGIAAPAFAHNYLVSSTPSAGETLTQLPSRFVITTNEGLLNLSGHGTGFALRIRDAKGLYYGDGCLTIDGPSMSTRAAIGAPGTYSVIWQVVSHDGHIVSNQFDFTWAPASVTAAAVGSKTPKDCGGKSGGAAPAAAPNAASTPQNANLGVVLGVGGGVLALGVILTVVLLVLGRRNPSREDRR